MKRLELAGLLFVAILALSAPATASAAVRCARVAPGEVGAWETPDCSVFGGLKLFIEVKTGGVNLGGGLECAEVEAGEPGGLA